MTLDLTKPDQLQTRDGMSVRIYATDGAGDYPVHGAVVKDSGWLLAKWTIDGRNHNATVTSPHDLVRKPARVTGWLNVYQSGRTGGEVWPTKEDAAKKAGVYSGVLVGQIYVDAEIQNDA